MEYVHPPKHGYLKAPVGIGIGDTLFISVEEILSR